MARNSLSRCKPLLGTFVEVTLAGDCGDSELIALSDQAFEEIARVQQRLSFHDKDSELSEFNRWSQESCSGEFSASDDFAQVLGLAQELNRFSDGRYDVCIAQALVANKLLPNHLALDDRILGTGADLQLIDNCITVKQPLCIDLGGIAKGYAVDCSFELLNKLISDSIGDTPQITINAGGDMRTCQWQDQTIALQFAAPNWARRRAKMLAPAVASSGHYYRKAIVDPLTGKASHQSGSVSVFASTATLADALTKLVWLLPDTKAAPILDHYNAKAVRISRFGKVRQL